MSPTHRLVSLITLDPAMWTISISNQSRKAHNTTLGAAWKKKDAEGDDKGSLSMVGLRKKASTQEEGSDRAAGRERKGETASLKAGEHL